MGIPVWTDDFYHPGVVIEDGLSRLGEDFTYVYDANAIDQAVLDETPVLVLAKSNVRDQAHRTPYMTEALANRLVRFVREGGGLLVPLCNTKSPWQPAPRTAPLSTSTTRWTSMAILKSSCTRSAIMGRSPAAGCGTRAKGGCAC